MAVAANSAPGSLGRYTPVINQLVAERASLNAKAVQGYGEYAATAGPDVAGDRQSPPTRTAASRNSAATFRCHPSCKTRRTARTLATGWTSTR